MEIHKSVRDVAIKHQLNIGRDYNGFYYVRMDRPEQLNWSFKTTAASGLALIRRELRRRKMKAGNVAK